MSSHPLASITRVEKSSLKINNTYVWNIHIRDNGKYYIFSFRPNNKHFGDCSSNFAKPIPIRCTANGRAGFRASEHLPSPRR